MCSPYPALDVLEYLFNLLETFGPADSEEAPPHSEDLTLTLSLCSDDDVLAITQLLSKQRFHLGVI